MIEGYLPFKDKQTYYVIFGEASNKPPLLFLHGGPGSTHNYFEVLNDLAKDRQLIMYDQIGCGNSYTEETSLFNMDTWIQELQALIKHLNLTHFHLLGQSWGGMLLLEYVTQYKPTNIQSIILSSTLPSSQMWGQEQARMIKHLPQVYQDAIKQAVSSNNYTDETYIQAEELYMLQHSLGNLDLSNLPEPLSRPRKSGKIAYQEAWGPNEFTPQGNLKDFDVTQQLKDIHIPTLITSGGNDLSTPYINKYMNDHIPNSKWVLFRDAAHLPFVECNQEYIHLLRDWMNDND